MEATEDGDVVVGEDDVGEAPGLDDGEVDGELRGGGGVSGRNEGRERGWTDEEERAEDGVVEVKLPCNRSKVR